MVPGCPTWFLAGGCTHRFLRRHSLHWLEALSLMHHARQAPAIVQSLQKTIEIHFSQDDSLRSLVADAH
ncbi:hypothetical protein BJX99DRAFT_237945 [Aspergillus californicus]